MPSAATAKKQRPLRIFYLAGPGDLVAAHKTWSSGQVHSSEVSVTFSSQIAEALKPLNCRLWMQSNFPRREVLRDGLWKLENKPEKPIRASGAGYYLVLLARTLGILRRVLAFRTQVLLIDAGRNLWFPLLLLRWFGVKVIPILHNTFWPAGHPPTDGKSRLLLKLDRWFWKRGPAAALAVSPEIRRQLAEVTGPVSWPVEVFKPQFLPDFFKALPPADFAARPFRVLFVGRVEREKGVFDILDMARRLEARQPGRFAWEICGSGGALEELKTAVAGEPAVAAVVKVLGRLDRTGVAAAYGRSHVVIVPTRDSFAEGFAMVAAEAILSGRPCLTNPVVPALEVLAPACLEAKTNDVESYVAALEKLAGDAGYYQQKQQAARTLGADFLDPAHGLTAKLVWALEVAGIKLAENRTTGG